MEKLTRLNSIKPSDPILIVFGLVFKNMYVNKIFDLDSGGDYLLQNYSTTG